MQGSDFWQPCAPPKSCRNQKSFWDPSTYHPNTTGVGWFFFILKKHVLVGHPSTHLQMQIFINLPSGSRTGKDRTWLRGGLQCECFLIKWQLFLCWSFIYWTQDARANEVDSGTELEEDEIEEIGSVEEKGEEEKKEDWGDDWRRPKTQSLIKEQWMYCTTIQNGWKPSGPKRSQDYSLNLTSQDKNVKSLINFLPIEI